LQGESEEVLMTLNYDTFKAKISGTGKADKGFTISPPPYGFYKKLLYLRQNE